MDDQRRLYLVITREVADEWTRDGRMHLPPDDTSGDDDLAFWNEVDRRGAERAGTSADASDT
jgi:hypothetical protein